jgi:UDP-N-acetylmuramoylalanine--D-glutamate ligase
MDIKDKKIVIVGLSVSGYAAACLAAAKKAKVFVTESADNKLLRQKAKALRQKGVETELGRHSVEWIKQADFIVTSPGVKPDALPIKIANKYKIPIYSEIEFAGWFCKKPVIAITGSNGKTTVTTLIGKILKKAGKKTVVCGNIGNPFAGEYKKFKTADIFVIEVSSFQLEHIRSFKPHISIILNITQNHFDHHKDFKEYAAAKARIFENQTGKDFTILNFDDKNLRKLAVKTKAKVLFFSGLSNPNNQCIKNSQATAHFNDGNIEIYSRRKKVFSISCDRLKIKGIHNIENAMAVGLCAKALNIENKTICSVLASFKGLEHRCEKVASIDRVDYINDSKSTTVDATDKALSIFKDKSVILICGGKDKGSDFTVLKPNLAQKAEYLIAIGKAKPKIIKAYSDIVKVKTAKTLEQAVSLAKKLAKPKQNVLLSPMCASFDMFDNFKHRGRVFKQIVEELRKKCI